MARRCSRLRPARAMVIAGIGCRLGCTAEEVVAIIRQAAAQAGRMPGAIAAPGFKRAEPGLLEAAQALGLTLRLVGPAALAATQAACPTRSATAERHVGAASVAEGCALAAAGPGGRLLLPRIATARATCALAET